MRACCLSAVVLAAAIVASAQVGRRNPRHHPGRRLQCRPAGSRRIVHEGNRHEGHRHLQRDGADRERHQDRHAGPDVIFLPFELMSTLSLDGGIKPGTFTPLGRSEMGLAVPAGKPHPDISTVEKLAAVLRSAKAVMRSNPAGGSMVARVIEQNVIKRPEFAGVNSPVSTRGEGGQALVRGEGDMALQAICEILPYKEIELVGPLPRELGAWIDMSAAVSARSTQLEQSNAFIRYITRPEVVSVWKAKGLDRF